jgi:hypothetical protein
MYATPPELELSIAQLARFQHAPTRADTLDLYFALDYSRNCFLCRKPMEKSHGDKIGRSARAQSGQVINDETDQRENNHHLESRGWYN